MRPLPSKKALVISGGGSKGAFAVGVLKFLNAMPQMDFDIFCGTSTGSLIVPFAALGRVQDLEHLYTSLHTEDLLKTGNALQRFTGNYASLYDANPLANVIKEHFTNALFKDLQLSSKRTYLATVCLQTQDIVYFTNSDIPVLSNEYLVRYLDQAGPYRAAMFASASQPVFMPPMQVIPEEPFQYVDGGVREYVPIDLAIDAGATEIYAILLSPASPDRSKQRFDHPLPILQRTLDVFMTDIALNDLRRPIWVNRSLTYMEKVKENMRQAGLSEDAIHKILEVPFDNPFAGKRSVKIHMIRPQNPLGGGPGGLEFNPTDMKQMLAIGEQTAANYFNSLLS
jgi:NTE family protein